MIKGLDTSHFNGTPKDWKRVKAAGYDFVLCKASDGDSFVDPVFLRDSHDADKAGLVVGAYHFFRPLKDAHRQSQLFVNTVKAAKLKLILSIDLEPALTAGVDDWASLTPQQSWERAEDWLDDVQEEFRYVPMIYTDQPFADEKLQMCPFGVYTKLWLAKYAPQVPAGWKNYTVWQFGEKGIVDGIPGNVDQDRFEGTFEELAALTIQV